MQRLGNASIIPLAGRRGCGLRRPQETVAIDTEGRNVDPSAKYLRRTGSIGLGLYIAREVVEAHGGTIRVASTAERGTTFTVRLPRSNSAASASPIVGAPHPPCPLHAAIGRRRPLSRQGGAGGIHCGLSDDPISGPWCRRCDDRGHGA